MYLIGTNKLRYSCKWALGNFCYQGTMIVSWWTSRLYANPHQFTWGFHGIRKCWSRKITVKGGNALVRLHLLLFLATLDLGLDLYLGLGLDRIWSTLDLRLAPSV